MSKIYTAHRRQAEVPAEPAEKTTEASTQLPMSSAAAASSGPGKPRELEEAIRARMENAFGPELSAARPDGSPAMAAVRAGTAAGGSGYDGPVTHALSTASAAAASAGPIQAKGAKPNKTLKAPLDEEDALEDSLDEDLSQGTAPKPSEKSVTVPSVPAEEPVTAPPIPPEAPVSEEPAEERVTAPPIPPEAPVSEEPAEERVTAPPVPAGAPVSQVSARESAVLESDSDSEGSAEESASDSSMVDVAAAATAAGAPIPSTVQEEKHHVVPSPAADDADEIAKVISPREGEKGDDAAAAAAVPEIVAATVLPGSGSPSPAPKPGQEPDAVHPVPAAPPVSEGSAAESAGVPSTVDDAAKPPVAPTSSSSSVLRSLSPDDDADERPAARHDAVSAKFVPGYGNRPSNRQIETMVKQGVGIGNTSTSGLVKSTQLVDSLSSHKGIPARMFSQILEPISTLITGTAGATTGLIGTGLGAVSTYRTLKKIGSGASKLDAFLGGADTTVTAAGGTNGALGVASLLGAHLGNAIPIISIAAGGTSVLTGATQAIRGAKAVSTFDDLLDELEGKDPKKKNPLSRFLSRRFSRRKRNAALVGDDQKELYKILLQARRVSERNRTGGLLKSTAGAMGAATGALALTGAAAPIALGTAILGGITGLGSFIYEKVKKHKLRKAVVEEEKRTYDRDELRKEGYRSWQTRHEAYADITRKRARYLLRLASDTDPKNQAKAEMATRAIEALGVKRRGNKFQDGALELLAAKLT